MLVTQCPSSRVSDSAMNRMLEEKRAIDLVPDSSSASVRQEATEKWAETFDAILASHRAAPTVSA